MVKPTKPTKEILHYYDPDFVPKIISYFFQKANIAKIMVNVQKRLNEASSRADYWHGEDIDYSVKKKTMQRKKALNSDFH